MSADKSLNDGIDFNQYKGRTDVSDASQFDAADDNHALKEQLGNEETRSFEYDPERAGKRFVDLYDERAAAIREFISNAETACIRRAIAELLELGYTNDDIEEMDVPEIVELATDEAGYHPIIDIEVEEGDSKKLTIKDNGIGISVEEFLILKRVGYSASHMEGKVNGQFGMGFMSGFLLCGKQGRFRAYTRSYQTDETYSTYVTLKGFKDLSGTRDNYGTTFEFFLSDEAKKINIQSKVEEFTQELRIPVRYEKSDGAGSVLGQEDYTPTKLEDRYRDGTPYIVYADEFVRVVTSPDANEKTVNVAQPIERNDGGTYGTRSYASPWTFDIRVKREDGPVVEGPHKGLVPVEQSQYNSALLEEREGVISPSVISPVDVVGFTHELENGKKVLLVDEDDAKDVEYIREKDNCRLVDDLPDTSDSEAYIVDGENEGRKVISEEEWESMDEGRASSLIPRSDLTEEDIEAPSPTGDRDRFRDGFQEFWRWCGSKVAEAFREQSEDLFRRVTCINDLANLEPVERSVYMRGISRFGPSYRDSSVDTIQEKFKNELGVDIPEDFAAKFPKLQKTVSVAPRGSNYPDKKRYRNSKKIWKVVRDTVDADVYMGCTINESKAKVAWELDDENMVVKVSGTNMYDVFEDLFGWKLLKEIDLYNLEEEYGDDLGDDVIDNLSRSRGGSGSGSNSGANSSASGSRKLDPKTRVIEVKNRRRTSDVYPKKIKEKFESDEPVSLRYGYEIEKLALFPSTEPADPSDYYWMAKENIGVAKCPQYVYDYLIDVDNVYKWADLLEEQKAKKVSTVDGEKRVDELEPTDMFVIISDERRGLFKDREDEILEALLDIDRDALPVDDKDEMSVNICAPGVFEESWMPFADSDVDADPFVITLDTSVSAYIPTYNPSSVSSFSIFSRMELPHSWLESDIVKSSIGGRYATDWTEENMNVLKTLKQLEAAEQSPVSVS